jgi:hypothetical protein
MAAMQSEEVASLNQHVRTVRFMLDLCYALEAEYNKVKNEQRDGGGEDDDTDNTPVHPIYHYFPLYLMAYVRVFEAFRLWDDAVHTSAEVLSMTLGELTTILNTSRDEPRLAACHALVLATHTHISLLVE